VKWRQVIGMVCVLAGGQGYGVYTGSKSCMVREMAACYRCGVFTGSMSYIWFV